MKISSEQEMLDLGAAFAKKLPRSAVLELIGDVGAGKTTFVRGLAQGLEIKSEITSPSFTISKSYPLKSGGNLIHYDFYRLGDPGLMRDNLAETISGENLVVIEWGASVKNLLPENRFTLTISINDDGSRSVKISQTSTKKDERVSLVGSAGRKDLTRAARKAENTPVEDRKLGRSRSASVSVTALSVSETECSRLSVIEMYLDTSNPTTILKLNDKTYEWTSSRELAEKLLEFIHEKLTENGADFQDITKITFFSGPGSFTGLRIGAAVVNTLSHELNIPLYDHKGTKRPIILPDYGRPARITKPKK